MEEFQGLQEEETDRHLKLEAVAVKIIYSRNLSKYKQQFTFVFLFSLSYMGLKTNDLLHVGIQSICIIQPYVVSIDCKFGSLCYFFLSFNQVFFCFFYVIVGKQMIQLWKIQGMNVYYSCSMIWCLAVNCVRNVLRNYASYQPTLLYT